MSADGAAGLKNAYESIKAFSETDFTICSPSSRHGLSGTGDEPPTVVTERRTRFRGRGISRPLRAAPVHEIWRVDRPAPPE